MDFYPTRDILPVCNRADWTETRRAGFSEMSVNTDQKVIKNKVGLLNLADMLGSVVLYLHHPLHLGG